MGFLRLFFSPAPQDQLLLPPAQLYTRANIRKFGNRIGFDRLHFILSINFKPEVIISHAHTCPPTIVWQYSELAYELLKTYWPKKHCKCVIYCILIPRRIAICAAYQFFFCVRPNYFDVFCHVSEYMCVCVCLLWIQEHMQMQHTTAVK